MSLCTPQNRTLLEKLRSASKLVTNASNFTYHRTRWKLISWWVVVPSSNPQAGGSSLVGCSLFLIQHIGSYSANFNKVFFFFSITHNINIQPTIHSFGYMFRFYQTIFRPILPNHLQANITKPSSGQYYQTIFRPILPNHLQANNTKPFSGQYFLYRRTYMMGSRSVYIKSYQFKILISNFKIYSASAPRCMQRWHAPSPQCNAHIIIIISNQLQQNTSFLF